MSAAATVTASPVKVGDIFYASWGYDQTNVDYYVVVRTTKAKAELKPIGYEVVEDRGPGGMTIVPDPDSYRDFDVLINTGRCSEYGKPVRETKLCTVSTASWNGETVIKLGCRHNAYRYMGGMNDATSPGWGH